MGMLVKQHIFSSYPRTFSCEGNVILDADAIDTLCYASFEQCLWSRVWGQQHSQGISYLAKYATFPFMFLFSVRWPVYLIYIVFRYIFPFSLGLKLLCNFKSIVKIDKMRLILYMNVFMSSVYLGIGMYTLNAVMFREVNYIPDSVLLLLK